MSNTQSDSFIDEVTEELRRDRLFAAFRRYGWIGLLIVALIVGGTAWREITQARERASAQGFGDALREALDSGVGEDRLAAISVIPASPEQEVVKTLALSADTAENREAAIAALSDLAAREGLEPAYRDLAVLRLYMLTGEEAPIEARRQQLEPLAAAGRPYAPLAQEQLAWLLMQENRTDEAIAAFSALIQDQASPAGVRERASATILALGGSLPEPPAPAPAAPEAAAAAPASGG